MKGFIRVQCLGCARVNEVNALIYSLRKKERAGLTYDCSYCGSDLLTVGVVQKAAATDNTRRSKKQERRVAVREGGHRQPGSGARDGFEGDVRNVGKYRGECKFTRASSYSLKLADLKKLEAQAGSGELPAFDVEFQSESPAKRYVIMPEWAYETLMVESGRREDA